MKIRFDITPHDLPNHLPPAPSKLTTPRTPQKRPQPQVEDLSAPQLSQFYQKLNQERIGETEGDYISDTAPIDQSLNWWHPRRGQGEEEGVKGPLYEIDQLAGGGGRLSPRHWPMSDDGRVGQAEPAVRQQLVLYEIEEG